jgi:serine/threonine protein kinase/Flp pilus assembly protein TadD
MNKIEAPVQASVSLDDPRVIAALDEYMAAVEAGRCPDRDAFLARYSSVAGVLAACLDGMDVLHTLEPSDETAGVADAGRPLGDFRILREIGRGGMGVVYEAEQVSLGRRVALKVLPFASTLDAKQLQRFKNEAQAAAGLHHTNIVPVFATGCERGVHYYAMQYIEGQSLAQVIAELRRSMRDPETACKRSAAVGEATADAASGHRVQKQERETINLSAGLSTNRSIRNPAFFRTAARLGVQAAEALEHAHQLGIVHRDIKPANLLVDGRGSLWITDFGLAHCQNQVGLTMTGDLVGTLRYMSPEQALAKRVIVDHRTDVYSLGVTLYEWLTLAPAFNGSDREELLRQIAFEEPRWARQLNRSIPAELEIIVLKAMEKNPAERYATAQELADDLERFLKDEPIRAKRPSPVQRARKWARRHQPMVWSGAAALLAIVAVIAGSIGWVAADRGARRAKAAGSFEEALLQAAAFMKEENWLGAKAAAQRAGDLLADTGGDELLDQRLKRVVTDLDIAAKLELARLRQTEVKDGQFDDLGAAAIYADAFRDYNLPVLELEPEEAARRIAASTIRDQLLAALGNWLVIDHSIDDKKLRAVIRLAETDPWWQKVFAVFDAKDWPEFTRLTQQPEALGQPAAGLVTLALVLSAHDLPAAVDFLRRAQQRHPDDFWINHNLARYLKQVKPPQLDEAIGFYRAALALRPQSPGVHLNLGNALRDKGQLDGAILAYREAIRLKADYAEAHLALGLGLARNGRTDEAIAEYQEAIRFKSDYAGAHNILGKALLRTGRLDKAIAEYQEAIRLKSDEAEYHYNLGIALHSKGRPKDAIAEYQEAIRLKSDYAEAHTNLGAELHAQGKTEAAVAEYRKAIGFMPHLATAHLNLGNALLEQGKLPEAMDEYRLAVRLKPDDARAHNGLGRGLQAQGRLGWAVIEYRRAIELKPDLGVAHENLVSAHVALRQYDQAIADLAKGIEDQPQNPQLWYRLGLLRLYTGDTTGYRKLCAEMVEHFGQAADGSVLHHIVWTCVLSENAVANFRPVLHAAHTLAGNYPKTWPDLNRLGVALCRAGRLEEAVQRLNEAEKLGTDGWIGLWDSLVLALVQGRLGRIEAAKKQLAKADAWMAEHATRMFWAERLQAEVLGREAHQLLGIKLPAPPEQELLPRPREDERD